MAKTTTKPAEGSEDQADDEAEAVESLDTAVITLEFRGQKFEVPKRRGRWPIEAILQFGRGQGLQAFRELFSTKDWERLKTVCPTGDDFDEFKDYGVDALMAEAIL